MQSQAGIEALAYAKLKDAEILLDNQRFDSAYYLAGYAIELLLKARYLTGMTLEDVKDFITSIKEVMLWIQKHL